MAHSISDFISGQINVSKNLARTLFEKSDKHKKNILCTLFGIYCVKKFYNVLDQNGFISRITNGIPSKELTSKQHGGNIVANVLAANNVDTIFCLSGGHISPIFVGCELNEIKIVDVRHEANSVFAADAHARLSGTIGVAVVTAGPGVTNTITPLKNAQMAQSPVLLIGGAAPQLQKDKGALQDIDHISIVKSICKFTAVVRTVRDIIPLMTKAISIAYKGTPGPVFLEMPIDVLYSTDLIRQEVEKEIPKKGVLAPIISFVVNTHLNNLCTGMPSLDYSYQSRRVDSSDDGLKIHNSDLKSVAKMLSAAKKPVVVFSSQATLVPHNLRPMVDLIDQLKIPSFCSGMSRGLFGKKNNNFYRYCRSFALKNSDCIILLGLSVDFRLRYGTSLNRKAKIIMVNRSIEEGTKNSPMLWQPSKLINCDPSKFFLNLGKTMNQLGLFTYSNGELIARENWQTQLTNLENQKIQGNYQKMAAFSKDHINPIKLLSCLNEILDENSTIVTDGGDFIGSASYILQPRQPLSWLDPGAFGTLGVGGGFTLAASLLNKKAVHSHLIPSRETWLLWGDGSCGFSLTEIDTMVRNNLPVIILIGNDACWTQIAREQRAIFKTDAACSLNYTRYEQAALGLGAAGGFLLDALYDEESGKMIEESDGQQRARISNVLIEARDLAKSKQLPVLVNCLIGGTDFRDGSISM